MATAVIIFGNHGLTHRLDPGLIRVETGAAINPVTWTLVSAGCGSPTGLRSEQACPWCACLVATLPGDACGRLDSGPKRSATLESLWFPHLRAITRPYRAQADAAAPGDLATLAAPPPARTA